MQRSSCRSHVFSTGRQTGQEERTSILSRVGRGTLPQGVVDGGENGDDWVRRVPILLPVVDGVRVGSDATLEDRLTTARLGDATVWH